MNRDHFRVSALPIPQAAQVNIEQMLKALCGGERIDSYRTSRRILTRYCPSVFTPCCCYSTMVALLPLLVFVMLYVPVAPTDYRIVLNSNFMSSWGSKHPCLLNKPKLVRFIGFRAQVGIICRLTVPVLLLSPQTLNTET